MHSSSVIQNDVEKIEETIKQEIELEKVPETNIKSTYTEIKRRPRAPRIQAVHQREEVLNSTNETYGNN
jgi:cellobiose-specific phosphotransferase system component IIB